MFLVWFALSSSLLRSQYTPGFYLYLYRRRALFLVNRSGLQGGENLIFLDEFYLLERYINVVFHFISFQILIVYFITIGRWL